MTKINKSVSAMTMEDFKTLLVQKGFKPATTLNEIGARVRGKHLNVTFFSKVNLTSSQNYLLNLKKIFLDTPEILLFRDDESELIRQYTRMFQNSTSKLDKFEDVLSTMKRAVLEIYEELFKKYDVKYSDLNYRSDFLSKISTFKEIKEDGKVMTVAKKNDNEKPVKDKKSRVILSKTMKKQFKNDKTPIEKFVDSQMDESKGLLKYFIEKKDIHTLGDFLVKYEDTKWYHTIYVFSTNNFKSAFEKLIENIQAYMNKNESANLKEVKHSKTEDEVLKTLTAENFIKNLQKLPAELFKKGSESMKRINAVKTEYVKKISNEYINGLDDLNETDVVEVMDSEYAKINAIIDEKRDEIKKKEEEAAREAKRAELIAFAAKKAAEEEEYKVKPDMFNKELGVHKDRRAGKFDRNL